MLIHFSITDYISILKSITKTLSLFLSPSHLHNLSLSLLFYLASHIYTFFYYYTLYFYLFILQCIFKNISFSLSLTYIPNLFLSLVLPSISLLYIFLWHTLLLSLYLTIYIKTLSLSLSLTQYLSLTHKHSLFLSSISPILNISLICLPPSASLKCVRFQTGLVLKR